MPEDLSPINPLAEVPDVDNSTVPDSTEDDTEKKIEVEGDLTLNVEVSPQEDDPMPQEAPTPPEKVTVTVAEGKEIYHGHKRYTGGMKCELTEAQKALHDGHLVQEAND